MGGCKGHSMDRFIDFLGRKPEVGGISGVTGLIGSIIIRPDIQEFILFILQFMVLITSLIVGVLTIIGWARKQKHNK